MAIKFSNDASSQPGKTRNSLRERKRGKAYTELLSRRREIDSKSRKLKIKLNELNHRVSERQVSLAVLEYLAQSVSGEATVAELRQKLPSIIEMGAADFEASESRPGEPRWFQQIRNIVSHRNVDGSFISDGLLSYDGSGVIRITDKGRHIAGSSSSDEFD
jgi:seryl-tRNA synthetase